MNKYLTAILCTALTVVILKPAAGEKTDSVPPKESDRIIALIFARGIEIYKKYSGVESIRKETISEYDPDTNKLKSVSEVTIKRKDFFYKNPEVEVLAYKKDGKEMEPATFRVFKSMPLYPVFDENGRDNYLITIAEKIKHDGRACYRIQVEPRKETSRHFRGSIYAAVSNLETIYIEGTIAKLDFPVKEFRLALNTKRIDDVPVAHSGEIHVRVKIPIFYPDTIIVSSISVIENRLMQ